MYVYMCGEIHRALVYLVMLKVLNLFFYFEIVDRKSIEMKKVFEQTATTILNFCQSPRIHIM